MAGKKNKQARSKFEKHAKDDAALAPKPEPTTPSKSQGLTIVGRVGIFLAFPSVVGLIGLYMGYLAKKDDPDKDLSFDTDFALPFVLALSICVVIGFQTRGFTSTQPAPLVAWPKVKKRQKIVHKHVVKRQNPDEVEGIEHNMEKTKKALEEKKAETDETPKNVDDKKND